VTWSYAVPGLRAGALLSLLSALGLLAAALAPRLRGRWRPLARPRA